MTDENDGGQRHFVLHAEAGHFTVKGSSSAVVNTAIIASESLRSPLEISIVEPSISGAPVNLGRHRVRDSATNALATKGPIAVTPTFKLVFLSVLAITALAGVAQIIMAFVWEKPTVAQQEVFEAMGSAWKTGFGAVVGLLGGKAT